MATTQKASRKKAATKKAAAPRDVIVPDTSVLVDGRLTLRVQNSELANARLLIPVAVVAELESQANRGRESGFNGLDEIVKLQELRDAANLEIEFTGERPTPEDFEHAEAGRIDALIREVAFEHDALLLTSDRVQAHVSRALGLRTEYIRPVVERDEEGYEHLELLTFFDDETMSVHLRYGVPPIVKKGDPGSMRLERLGDQPMELHELTRMRREIIEAARRDPDSFVEIERHGATVVQLGPIRVAIAQPPFSDAVEITAVRPVVKLDLEDYELAPELQDRLQEYSRGVFVSGPPGSGKSTFVTSVAEWLNRKGTIVKTMEQPRDLQVSEEITQYAPLDRDMALTSDVLLLVRPDYVIYDEVRKTNDFEVFADMRLAGVGLIGVTHANRAIDAIQRLVGRVELGMIPQVVDTVIHIEKGKVGKILELSFTVKTPHGMQDQDLARPVIEVKDFQTGVTEYELYTYGEQIVVMPLKAGDGAAPKKTATDRMAEAQLRHVMRRYLDGRYEVEFKGADSAILYAEDWEVPKIIGKGGRTIQHIQEEVGVKFDVRPLSEMTRGRRGGDDGGDGGARPPDRAPARRGVQMDAATITPEVRKTKKNIVLVFGDAFAGQTVEILADGEPLFSTTVSRRGDVRVHRRNDEADLILEAIDDGCLIQARV